VWNWHKPGEKNGPVGVKTPVELGGTKRDGKGGNRTQAVVLKLLERLPGKGYHCFMDNLFVSERFLEFLRSKGYGATGTCRTNSGVITELIDLKKKDKGDTIPWGTLRAMPTRSGKVIQVGWKDNALVLGMSTVIGGEGSVERQRRKPKSSSTSAKTARAPFGPDEYIKAMSIPLFYDLYNYNMNAVDRADQLAANNSGLRHVRRGGWQATEHWILRVVLCNCFILALWGGPEGARQINFRSQVDFRNQLIDSLFSMGKEFPLSKKRRISHISQDYETLPNSYHHKIKNKVRRQCVACKGLRLSDRPQKRLALATIATDNNRPSKRVLTFISCKQCKVFLCSKSLCWARYHEI
jgi:hypothetical protein